MRYLTVADLVSYLRSVDQNLLVVDSSGKFVVDCGPIFGRKSEFDYEFNDGSTPSFIPDEGELQVFQVFSEK